MGLGATGVYGKGGTGVSAVGSTRGVYGQSASTGGIGVYGDATATSGPATGLYGKSSSTSGKGVFGYVPATTGTTRGVYGQSLSPNGIGVFGDSTATTGPTIGVCGKSSSSSGKGIEGTATTIIGTTWGVYGQSNSTSGIGVEGRAGNLGAIPIVARGALDQTASLQEWRNSAGTALSLVDKDGNILPGTDTAGSIGTASKRWGNVYAVTVTQGDLVFMNNFKVTENEKSGLAFKNDAGEKIAVLDREGNLHIKGRIIQDLK